MTPKQQLQKILQDVKTKKFREGEAKGLMSQIQEEQTKALQPVMEQMSKELGTATQKAVAEAMKGFKMPDMPKMEMPEIPAPVVTVEAPIVNIPAPIVNVPAPVVNVPQTKIPEYPKFPDRMFVEMDKVSQKAPLPVVLMDATGRYFQFPVGGGGGGGKTDFLTIKGFSQSAFAEITNPDGRLKVELPSGTSGLTDAELRAAHLDVQQLSGSADSVNVISTVGLTDTQLRAATIDIKQVSGASDSVNVVDAFGSTAVGSVFNADNRIRVSVETGGSGLTDAELRATAVPVSQLSGANWSVSVIDIFGSTGTNLINPDNRLKVELPTGSSGLTDTELRATAVPVSQLSGASWSTSVINTVTVDGSGVTQPVSATNLDIRDLDFATDDVSVYQVSGSAWSTVVNEIFGSTGTNVINPDNRLKVELPTGSSGLTDTELRATPVPIAQVSGHRWSTEATQSGTWDIGTVTAVTGITNTVAAMSVDSSGVGYSGSNPVPVTLVSGGLTSTIAVGDLASDAADTGSSPLKIGGIARTANPTAVAAGDRVSATFDDLGRQVVRNVQVRDLIKTAYVSVTNGTETTLRAAVAGAYLDLLFLKGSNNSDAAVSVDIRAVTAGNIIDTLRIPANGTAGWAPPVAWPQDETGNNWTVDGPDETGRTMTFSALFSQEI